MRFAAGLKDLSEILGLSGPDLTRLTRLSPADVQRTKDAAAELVLRPPVVTGIYTCSISNENLRSFSDFLVTSRTADVRLASTCLIRAFQFFYRTFSSLNYVNSLA